MYGGNTPDVEFDSSLTGKTILINVASTLNSATGKKEVTIDNWGKVFDTAGNSNKDILSSFKATLVWNFYDADKVYLGGGTGGPQFPGSLVIPHGDLDFRWPGADGRVIVGGDVWHEGEGSEFHNYELDPPCPLPLPPTVSVPPECGEECPPDPTEPFTVDIYMTYAGAPSLDPSTLSSSDITQMENAIKNEYNTITDTLFCDSYLREIACADIDTSSFVKAMNTFGMLDGFRAKVTLSGVCCGCVIGGVSAPLVQVECVEATANNCCPNNLEKIVSGKDLADAINAQETNPALQVLRIQSLESTGPSSDNLACEEQPGKTVQGYINPYGDLVCKVIA